MTSQELQPPLYNSLITGAVTQEVRNLYSLPVCDSGDSSPPPLSLWRVLSARMDFCGHTLHFTFPTSNAERGERYVVIWEWHSHLWVQRFYPFSKVVYVFYLLNECNVIPLKTSEINSIIIVSSSGIMWEKICGSDSYAGKLIMWMPLGDTVTDQVFKDQAKGYLIPKTSKT